MKLDRKTGTLVRAYFCIQGALLHSAPTTLQEARAMVAAAMKREPYG